MSEKRNEAAEMVWPIEARTIDEAKKIWEERGFTMVRKMTREELERRLGRSSGRCSRSVTFRNVPVR